MKMQLRGVSHEAGSCSFHIRRVDVAINFACWGGKGASLKLSIATCGLHFHVLGLGSLPSFFQNHGEHGVLGRFCWWRNLRCGRRGPRERTSPRRSARRHGVDVNGVLPGTSVVARLGKDRPVLCSPIFYHLNKHCQQVEIAQESPY